MRTLERFVDIHSHMLPGMDDGAANWEEALVMAQTAVLDGIAAVIATPHQLGNFGQNRGDTIRQRVAQFQGLLDGHGIPLKVLPGADVRIEPEIVHKIRLGDVLTLADRRSYVLLELPHEVYLPLERLLEDLRRAGLVGILSHPERNLGILHRPQLAQRLVEAGCRMQITCDSLMGGFGPASQSMAEEMLRQGLVHFLATDAHSPRTRRPLMRRAFDRACQLAGEEMACEVCSRNPARVLTDQLVAPGRVHTRPKPILARWFLSRRAG